MHQVWLVAGKRIKQSNNQPWKMPCVALIGLYQIPQGTERAHQTIGNLLHTFKPGLAELDPEEPWSGILSAVMFALWSTIHTTHKATPMQLVFRRDAMLNIMHLAN
eukprot:15365715-Ditylum_brightwellii.AAC.1